MIQKLENAFLLSTALGLAAIGLGYGIQPNLYPQFFNIKLNSTELMHIFRGINGLYIGLSVFWIVAVFKSHLKQGALLSVIAVMSGLILGRVSSIIVDGTPHILLQVFLVIEIITLVQGIFIYKKLYMK
jgi:hypothetical protein